MKYNAHIYYKACVFFLQSLKTSPELLTIIIMFFTCRGGFILKTTVAQSSFDYTSSPNYVSIVY